MDIQIQSEAGMKKDFSITRKIWNGINIEIRFDRYFIQFDDGQWQARVEIESLNRTSLPDCKCGYKEIIINMKLKFICQAKNA